MSRLALAKKGEQAAIAVAGAQGYRLLRRNYRCILGEIDLIMEKEDTLVFIEVKTRRGRSFGEAWEAVTPQKQERIRRVATWYIKETDPSARAFRFDVFTVCTGVRPWRYHWFQQAF